MVSSETLLDYTYRIIMFKVHTYYSGKQLVYVISKNNKPIAFLLRILNHSQFNYTIIEKKILSMVKHFYTQIKI